MSRHVARTGATARWDVDPQRSHAALRTLRGRRETLQAVFPAVTGRLDLDLHSPTRSTGRVDVDLSRVEVVPGEVLDRLPWRSWIDADDPILGFTVGHVEIHSEHALRVTGEMHYRGNRHPAHVDVSVALRQVDVVAGTARVRIPRQQLPLPRALTLSPAGRLLPNALLVVVELVATPVAP
jgi:polyisoprenoid-binding protein YceI